MRDMGNRQKNAGGVPSRGHKHRCTDTCRVRFNRRINHFLPYAFPCYFAMDGFRAAEAIEIEDEEWSEDEEPWQGL